MNRKSYTRAERLTNLPKALDYLYGRFIEVRLGFGAVLSVTCPGQKHTAGGDHGPGHRPQPLRGPCAETTAPGFTTRPRDMKGWSTGSPTTYRNGNVRPGGRPSFLRRTVSG